VKDRIKSIAIVIYGFVLLAGEVKKYGWVESILIDTLTPILAFFIVAIFLELTYYRKGKWKSI
jgi:uncharacterized membrane protein YadS